jgi:hypothetical protein
VFAGGAACPRCRWPCGCARLTSAVRAASLPPASCSLSSAALNHLPSPSSFQTPSFSVLLSNAFLVAVVAGTELDLGCGVVLKMEGDATTLFGSDRIPELRASRPERVRLSVSLSLCLCLCLCLCLSRTHTPSVTHPLP